MKRGAAPAARGRGRHCDSVSSRLGSEMKRQRSQEQEEEKNMSELTCSAEQKQGTLLFFKTKKKKNMLSHFEAVEREQ